MNKFLKRLALFFCSFSFMFSLSSCGFFNSSDEGLMIESITSEVLDDGSTEITINFTDEDMTPVTFTIPKGQQGEVGPTGPIGVGIDHIETTQSEDGLKTILTIYFTDPEKEPETIEVNNGVSITNISSSFDAETNSSTITITTSDGETHDFKIANGKDGVGIESVNSTTDPENGDIVITITLTDETQEPVVIRVPNRSGEDGEDGRGIESITSTQLGETYTIIITYTDGTNDELEFDMPIATVWYAGATSTMRIYATVAHDGDYFFNTETYTIYIFDGDTGNFSEVVNLSEITTSTAQYVVEFDAATNGGVLDAGFLNQYTVNSGYRFNTLPTATKEDATFIGWYSMPVPTSVNPNSGHFTTLNYVFSDLTLYACFE